MKRKNDSGEDEFGIQEVYYDKDGKTEGYTENLMVPFFDSAEGLVADFEKMKIAFEKEILDYDLDSLPDTKKAQQSC